MKKTLGTFEATNRNLNIDRSDKVTLEKMMFVSTFMRFIKLRVPTDFRKGPKEQFKGLKMQKSPQ